MYLRTVVWTTQEIQDDTTLPMTVVDLSANNVDSAIPTRRGYSVYYLKVLFQRPSSIDKTAI